MKTRSFYPHVDPEMFAVLKETFGEDEVLLTEALIEAERAFSYVKEDSEWHSYAVNGTYELF